MQRLFLSRNIEGTTGVGRGFCVDTNYATGKIHGPGPRGGDLSTRNTIYLGIAGFGNALLLTGNQKYVQLWRNMLAVMRSHARTIDGQVMYPHSYGEYSGVRGKAVPAPGQPGWFDYRCGLASRLEGTVLAARLEHSVV
eukprot:SAG25_NODE_486_length_7469_cov_4.137449_4_plen_139_part_00